MSAVISISALRFARDHGWIICLLRNLAVAGALCEAWEIGRLRGSLSYGYVSRRNAGRDLWEPGCGRPAP